MAISPREAYGHALVDVGRQHPEVVVLDADLAKATKTEYFAKEFPGRFFDVGIAEANLVGVAAGLALAGYHPFVSSFAVFVPGRSYDQIRNTVCYSKLNVKLIATHAGLATGEDGGTHQALEDLALTRALPYLSVYSPADATQTAALLHHLAQTTGPAYVRLARGGADAIYEDGYVYHERPDVLRSGSDVTVAATGPAVALALRAADELAAEGISARVINVHCLKPLDRELLVAAARETGGIVTVEDHSVTGGLGSAVLEALADAAPCPVARLGVRGTFGESGAPSRLYEAHGLTVQEITVQARGLVERKRGGRS